MDEQAGEPLSRFTTLKIGGAARRLCQPRSIEEMVALLADLKERDEPWYVIGGGSNLLVSSKGVEGTVIRTAQVTNVQQLEPNVLEAGAGARLPHLAKHAAQLGLSGLEFAVGIPGTVGGGVIMNAGAHGSCMAEIIESVTIFDTDAGEIVTLSKQELNFQYRKSKLDPARQVVLSAQLRLTSALLCTFCPLMAVMQSPAFRPARAAALPGSISVTSTPRPAATLKYLPSCSLS